MVRALIKHVGAIHRRLFYGGIAVFFRSDEFAENQKQLIRIDRANGQIVVSVFTIVEMESAKAAFVE